MYRQRRRKEAFIGKVGNVVKKGGKVVEDNTVGQVKKLNNIVQMIFRTIGAIPKKIAEFVKTIPKKTWEHIKRIFEPLVKKLKWLFDWFKTLCLCSCLLCLASSCFSLGLPQMMVSIVQGAGSVAASQAGDSNTNNSNLNSILTGDSAPNTNNTNNFNQFITGLNDSSNAGSLDALPTSMAMFNPRPNTGGPNTGGPAVGSVRMAIPTGGPTGGPTVSATNNLPNFSKNLKA